MFTFDLGTDECETKPVVEVGKGEASRLLVEVRRCLHKDEKDSD